MKEIPSVSRLQFAEPIKGKRRPDLHEIYEDGQEDDPEQNLSPLVAEFLGEFLAAMTLGFEGWRMDNKRRKQGFIARDINYQIQEYNGSALVIYAAEIPGDKLATVRMLIEPVEGKEAVKVTFKAHENDKADPDGVDSLYDEESCVIEDPMGFEWNAQCCASGLSIYLTLGGEFGIFAKPKK